MINVILSGYHGAMGQHLIEQIKASSDLTISAGIDRSPLGNPGFPEYSNFEQVGIQGDVIVDFSHHSLVDSLLDYAVRTNTPAVICTTGLSEDTKAHILKASQSVAIFQSGNMSLGINLLIYLSQKAAELLGDDYDIEIIERHHHRKLDAPSGTALMLADGINDVKQGKMRYQEGRSGNNAKRQENEIGIHAVRGGNIVGEHEVIFAGMEEIIELKHSAASRGVFAKGALRAAKFLVNKEPGLYNMNDMLSEL